MQEKSMTSNHGGGITGGEIIEKESWRGRHLGGMWEASERHLGSIWEASERHLGGIWEASETHLGGIWEATGRHLGVQAAMGLQEAPNLKIRCTSQLKCKSSIYL